MDGFIHIADEGQGMRRLSTVASISIAPFRFRLWRPNYTKRDSGMLHESLRMLYVTRIRMRSARQSYDPEQSGKYRRIELYEEEDSLCKSSWMLCSRKGSI